MAGSLLGLRSPDRVSLKVLDTSRAGGSVRGRLRSSCPVKHQASGKQWRAGSRPVRGRGLGGRACSAVWVPCARIHACVHSNTHLNSEIPKGSPRKIFLQTAEENLSPEDREGVKDLGWGWGLGWAHRLSFVLEHEPE